MTSPQIDRLTGLSSSSAIKAPVRAATTANISLSGEQTIDTVALVNGDRILVKDQTSGAQNGVYIVSTGNWARSPDFTTNEEVARGTQVRVNEGTNAGAFVLSTADPITIGTTVLTFVTDGSVSGLLQIANNLSDVANAVQSRVNLDTTADFSGLDTVGGTVDQITLTTARGLTLTDGAIASFQATGDNTSTVQINVDGLGLVDLKSNGAVALSAGDIVNKGIYIIRYDASESAWLILNSGGGGLSSPLSVDLDFGGNNATGVSSLFMDEKAAADADVAGDGQFWVKNDTPNKPMFTDDTGVDYQIGKFVQFVNTQSGLYSSGTTTMPYDDTIPQDTEGDEYLALAVTPMSATNKLKIDIVATVGHSVSTAPIQAALFQDGTSSALATFVSQNVNNGGMIGFSFTHFMTAGTASSTTFRLRIGSETAGTTYFNGISSGRKFGGTLVSSISITEIGA